MKPRCFTFLNLNTNLIPYRKGSWQRGVHLMGSSPHPYPFSLQFWQVYPGNTGSIKLGEMYASVQRSYLSHSSTQFLENNISCICSHTTFICHVELNRFQGKFIVWESKRQNAYHCVCTGSSSTLKMKARLNWNPLLFTSRSAWRITPEKSGIGDERD